MSINRLNKPLQQGVPPLLDIKSWAHLLTAFQNIHGYLTKYVKNMDVFQSDVVDNVTPLIWTASIPVAATLEPQQSVQPLTGGGTITTISTANTVAFLVFLAIDGFDLATGGNIAANVTVAQGRAVNLYKDLSNNLWYCT